MKYPFEVIQTKTHYVVMTEHGHQHWFQSRKELAKFISETYFNGGKYEAAPTNLINLDRAKRHAKLMAQISRRRTNSDGSQKAS